MKRLSDLVLQIERADELRQRSLARQVAAEAIPETVRTRMNAALLPSLALPQRLPSRCGETWLLLATASGEGLVARLGIRTGAKALEASSLRAARVALLSEAGRACRTLGSEARDYATLHIQDDDIEHEVTGRSAELAAAVSLASLALGKPPFPHVAGTAQVAPNGRLEPVHHLREKVRALHREWPLVTTLVVAQEQRVDDSADLEIVRVADLAAALRAFGLDVAELGPCDVDDHEARVRRLKAEGEKDGSDFAQLARDAWESGAVLRESHHHLAAKAYGCAALFMLHLGETSEAWAIQRGIDRNALAGEPDILAMVDTFAASAAIDSGDLAGAKTLALGAIELLGPPRSREHGAMVASARGTYGRAFLHAGEYEEAIVHLAASVELQERYAAFEAARSRGYLATAYRHAGKLDEARATIAHALEQNARDAPKRSASRQTAPFLHLEAGRVALAQGNLDDAERHLAEVGTDAARYPDLGADRTRVRAALRSGDVERARALAARCATTASALPRASALTQVGAIGFAELIVAHAATPEDEVRCVALLTHAFDRIVTREEVPVLVAAQVF